MLSMLTCPNCGAPLPRPMPGFPNLTCAFCGVTSRIDGPAPQATSEAKKTPQRETVRLSNVYIEAVKGAKASGENFHALVERLAAEHIGELVEPRALANTVANLIYDYEGEEAVTIHDDPDRVGRMVEATFKAFEEIAAEGETEMNLPFFYADDKGPRHFLRHMTAARFAELAARTPVAPADRAPAPAAAEQAPMEEEAPPKRGFFARLFGKD